MPPFVSNGGSAGGGINDFIASAFSLALVSLVTVAGVADALRLLSPGAFPDGEKALRISVPGNFLLVSPTAVPGRDGVEGSVEAFCFSEPISAVPCSVVSGDDVGAWQIRLADPEDTLHAIFIWSINDPTDGLLLLLWILLHVATSATRFSTTSKAAAMACSSDAVPFKSLRRRALLRVWMGKSLGFVSDVEEDGDDDGLTEVFFSTVASLLPKHVFDGVGWLLFSVSDGSRANVDAGAGVLSALCSGTSSLRS